LRAGHQMSVDCDIRDFELRHHAKALDSVGLRREEVLQLPTHINLHLLVDAIVHDQAMRQPNSMRFHGMPGDISIISNIGIVEVCNPLLGAWAVRWRLIDGGCKGCHFGRRRCDEDGGNVVLSKM
jgi:hypothetical protein